MRNYQAELSSHVAHMWRVEFGLLTLGLNRDRAIRTLAFGGVRR